MNQYLLAFIFTTVITLIQGCQSSPLPGSTWSLSQADIENTESIAASRALVRSQDCGLSDQYTGWRWWFHVFIAVVLVMLTGVLAGLTLAVMTVDVTRLWVYTKTGEEKQRFVLKLYSIFAAHGFCRQGDTRRGSSNCEVVPIGFWYLSSWHLSW